jgi:hypothetical protein
MVERSMFGIRRATRKGCAAGLFTEACSKKGIPAKGNARLLFEN